VRGSKSTKRESPREGRTAGGDQFAGPKRKKEKGSQSSAAISGRDGGSASPMGEKTLVPCGDNYISRRHRINLKQQRGEKNEITETRITRAWAIGDHCHHSYFLTEEIASNQNRKEKNSISRGSENRNIGGGTNFNYQYNGTIEKKKKETAAQSRPILELGNAARNKGFLTKGGEKESTRPIRQRRYQGGAGREMDLSKPQRLRLNDDQRRECYTWEESGKSTKLNNFRPGETLESAPCQTHPRGKVIELKKTEDWGEIDTGSEGEGSERFNWDRKTPAPWGGGCGGGGGVLVGGAIHLVRAERSMSSLGGPRARLICKRTWVEEGRGFRTTTCY